MAKNTLQLGKIEKFLFGIAPEHNMTLAEYRLEIYSLMQRIKMTAEMINSYMAKFHESGLLQVSSSAVANAAIELALKFDEADKADPTFWYDEERVKTSTLLKLGIDPLQMLERKLKILQRISMQMQEINVYYYEMG